MTNPIIGSIKHYDEIWKISTGQGDDYTIGFLFWKKLLLILF